MCVCVYVVCYDDECMTYLYKVSEGGHCSSLDVVKAALCTFTTQENLQRQIIKHSSIHISFSHIYLSTVVCLCVCALSFDLGNVLYLLILQTLNPCLHKLLVFAITKLPCVLFSFTLSYSFSHSKCNNKHYMNKNQNLHV